MMDILEGLLYINDVDVYKEYGVFLAEKAQDGHENYDALLAPSDTKEQTAVNIREEDGEKLPDTLVVTFKPRDVTLYFAVNAGSRAEFLKRRSDFLAFLRKGRGGWLDFHLPEAGRTFRFYLKSFPSWEQLAFGEEFSAARFQVTFREPKPAF